MNKINEINAQLAQLAERLDNETKMGYYLQYGRKVYGEVRKYPYDIEEISLRRHEGDYFSLEIETMEKGYGDCVCRTLRYDLTDIAKMNSAFLSRVVSEAKSICGSAYEFFEIVWHRSKD